MTNKLPETQSLSIVVIGAFTPAMFHPLWFSDLEIFSETEIKESINNLNVIHRDIADFSIEWCRIYIVENKLMIITKMDAYFERLRDLAVKIFEKLKDTPVKSMGINPDGEFDIKSEEKWHNIGHALTPKGPWAEITENPGMQELQMKDSYIDDEYKGYSLIRVRPSDRITYGLYIQVNRHFELGDPKEKESKENLLKILQEEFEPIINKWQNVYKKIISLGD